MYRISRVFETAKVVIAKVAGQVQDAELDSWTDCLAELGTEKSRWMVLDFGDVSHVGPLAADVLIRELPENVLLLNCPTDIKNMADSRGLCGQVLESNCGLGQPRCHCFLDINLTNKLQLSGGAS